MGWARQVEEFSHVVPSEQMVTVEGIQFRDLCSAMVVVVFWLRRSVRCEVVGMAKFMDGFSSAKQS